VVPGRNGRVKFTKGFCHQATKPPKKSTAHAFLVSCWLQTGLLETVDGFKQKVLDFYKKRFYEIAFLKQTP
jgi:hypothetical protein